VAKNSIPSHLRFAESTCRLVISEAVLSTLTIPLVEHVLGLLPANTDA
jgi:hypothetical protein